MPQMPPDPNDVQVRAAAVLRTLRLARRAVCDGGMIGLAPEGRDIPGKVGQLLRGVGDFIALLVRTGLPILPVGVTEQGGQLMVSFGKLFTPAIPSNREERDLVVAQQVMTSISDQLP
jgi:hypothetical protein